MTTVVVVLPSNTYRAGDFVAAAQALNLDLVVASENPPPLDMGDGYVQVDCSDPDTAAKTIVDLGDRTPIDGVVAADDAGVVVAALSAAELGLYGNDPDSARATRDKGEMRQRLAGTEVPQPRFGIIDSKTDPITVSDAVGFPLVVKPVDRSASQGVIRVDRSSELAPALERVRAITEEDAPILLEEFMPGVEVAVEGIVSNGALTTLAILDKPDVGEGPYFPETILVTPSSLDQETLSECERVARAALQGLGITHGPVHVELKVTEGQVRVIEVAARSIGGLCSKSLKFGLMGTTLESLILRNALGWDKPELRRETNASGVLMIPTPSSGVYRGITGLDEVRDLPGVTAIDIVARPGDRVAPPPEGDKYLGFVFAGGPVSAQVTTVLRSAMKMIRVEIQ